MAQEKDFSIISVNEDDDEVVISAGVVLEPEAKTSEVIEEHARETGDGTYASRARDNYRETTLEDLKETGPFSKMRHIILIGGLLGLIVFVVVFIITR